MADVERGPPFYERRRFQGAVAVLGLVGTLVALVGPPNLWDVIGDLFSSELPRDNTEIVLDTSAPMGERFGAAGANLTKLDAATDAVGGYAVPVTNEGLALRSF